MNRPNRFSLITLAFTILCLGGCNTIINQPPPSQLYTLRPLGDVTEQTALPANIIVSRPIASPGLERELIALIKPDHELSYYAQARWSASTSELVRFFLIDSLQNQGIFQSVTPDVRFSGNNYRLDVHVQDFQAAYQKADSNPMVQLKLAFTLTDLARRQAKASFVESVEVPIQENRLTQVVDGFQEAMNRATQSALVKVSKALAAP